MRDSDWSRQNLLRSDWLVPKVASLTTFNSSLFSSKYFYFYNVKVVAKASSNFPQYHMILTPVSPYVNPSYH